MKENFLPQWIFDAFESLGFFQMPCNWANGLWEDSDDEIAVEVVTVSGENGSQYYRLFATALGEREDGGVMKYLHSFVRNAGELERFVGIARTKLTTTEGEG